MNQYGSQAMQHWARWLPMHYAAIPDPVGFFTELGEEAARQIDELADTFGGDDGLHEGYLVQVQHLTMARKQAEEIVRSKLLPDPQTDRQVDDSISARVRAGDFHRREAR